MTRDDSAQSANAILTKIYNFSTKMDTIENRRNTRYIQAQDLISAFTDAGAKASTCPSMPEVTHINFKGESISIKAENTDDTIDLISYPGAVQLAKKIVAPSYNIYSTNNFSFTFC